MLYNNLYQSDFVQVFEKQDPCTLIVGSEVPRKRKDEENREENIIRKNILFIAINVPK